MEIHGPTDYLSHALTISSASIKPRAEILSKTPKIIRGSDGISIPKSIAKRQNLLGQCVFPEYLGDLINQQVHGLTGQCTYLTNSVGQAEFLQSLGGGTNALGFDRSSLLPYLAHSVPFFSGIPLETLLRIRQNESDAFVRYRAALNRIVRDKTKPDRPTGKREAQELFEDELRPRILALKVAAKTAQRGAIRKSLTKAGISVMAISMGLFGGLLPKEFGEILSTIGGVGFLSELGETVTAIRRDPPSVRDDDLYFLLRLSRETSG